MEIYLVTARDAEDDGAYERRMAVRADHLAALETLKARGTMRFAMATLGADGRIDGSVMVLACRDRAELDCVLAADPYTKNNVWGKVTVQPGRIAPPFDTTAG